MAEADDWAPVKQQADDDWQPVAPADRPAPTAGDAIPEAFLDRVRAGQALGRITAAAAKEGAEGFAGTTPTGLSDETLNHLTDLGIFHDPARGKAGPIQFANEAVMLPAAQAWQAITSTVSAGIHGAGGAMEQMVNEFGGSQGTANRAKNEVINAGNWAMIEGGMGRFSRPTATPNGVMDQTVGGLPRPEDFSNGAKVLGDSPHAEANLKQMWQEDGIHPAEAVHDAQGDAFLKNEITAPREEINPDPETGRVLEETGGKAGSLSAAVNDAPYTPLDVQPPSPPGRLITAAQNAADKLFDVGHDIQMKLTPMARGSVDSMATVKDYMNSMRRNSWDVSRIDTDLTKRFSAEDRTRLANAMEEESLSRRLNEPEAMREHQGLATLTPEERQTVVDLDTRQQLAYLKARDLGIVEGDGIAMHYPRMVVGIPKGLDKSGEGSMSLTAIGYDLRSRTPQLKQRKYMELEDTEKAVKDKIGMQLAQQGKSVDEINAALEKVKVVRDIRAVNLATKQLEDAVAGRSLIENIKEIGKRTGEETVAEGFKPDDTWFTVDHPSFNTWRPKFKDGEVVKDAAGNAVMEQVPLYVRGDFEGPLRSAMWGSSGETYKAMMQLKGKTMSYIMNSPMIHNMVEFGRAVPAIRTRIFKAYIDGNRVKQDPAFMHDAIGHGLVPIGKRFFNQDINAVMEEPNLTPGRSMESQILAAVPGLFDEAAGTAVKQAVDKLGNFWHNTLLWDRIADLQAGIFKITKEDLIGKGQDPNIASYIAAHYANRYAGALPKEAMSEMATKISNFAFFSRSFTFGNLGVLKDMFTGLPKDVLAQIERDAGFQAGSIEGADAEGAAKQAVTSAKSIARRKAISVVGLDIALAYVGNTLLQNSFNVMLGDSSWSQEGHDYLRRMWDTLNDAKVHPLSLLNPFYIPDHLSATSENEPGRGDRVMIGKAKDGTAIYGRNPVGKIGEEFSNYFSSPLDMLRKKEGTVMRPFMQLFSNDAGFGRKIYDPTAHDAPGVLSNALLIAKHLAGSQLPMGQIHAGIDLVKGEGDKYVNELQAFGPFAGFTFSKGAPGGPQVGEMYANKSAVEFRQQQAMPDIRKQILRGDIAGAKEVMTNVGMDAGYQSWVTKTTLNPSTRLSARSLRDFYRTATPEQRDRMTRIQQAPQAPQDTPVSSGPPVDLGAHSDWRAGNAGR